MNECVEISNLVLYSQRLQSFRFQKVELQSEFNRSHLDTLNNFLNDPALTAMLDFQLDQAEIQKFIEKKDMIHGIVNENERNEKVGRFVESGMIQNDNESSVTVLRSTLHGFHGISFELSTLNMLRSDLKRKYSSTCRAVENDIISFEVLLSNVTVSLLSVLEKKDEYSRLLKSSGYSNSKSSLNLTKILYLSQLLFRLKNCLITFISPFRPSEKIIECQQDRSKKNKLNKC